MAESAESLFRRGAISPKQAGKHQLGVLKKTKVERADEEAFMGKQGAADQGKGKLKGVFGTRHIEAPELQGTEKKKNTGFKFDNRLGNSRGSPGAGEIDESEHQSPEFPKAGGSRKPSKGGAVAGKGSDEGVDEINTRSNQKPSFPKASSKAGWPDASNKKARGKVAKSGGYYGGGGQSTQ